METYTLYREDPETGEEIEIELEVEIDHFHPGGPTHSRSISDNPGQISLGDIFRVDTGERFEPTREELSDMMDDLWLELYDAWSRGD